MKLELRQVSYQYDFKPVLNHISFSVESGDMFALLGPNGAGKTTLFKIILGLLKPSEGEILIDGIDIQKMTRAQIATYIGYIPQNHVPPFSFTVLDIVLMGRTVHLKPFSSPTQKDVKIAQEAMEILGIEHLQDTLYTEISGGERQLVLIARAIAQKSKLFIMDEPTSALDFGNQMKVLKYVQQLSKNGFAIMMSTHHPNQALQYANKVALMNQTEIQHVGKPEDILTEQRLKEIYGVPVQIADAHLSADQIIKVCVSV